MRIVSDRIFGDILTDILYTKPSPEIRSVCNIMWVSVLQPK